MVTLSGLINATRTAKTTYSGCMSAGAKAAAYPNERSITFIPFYHEATDENMGKTSECNREHTWPKSRGGDLIETDPIVIRPTFNKDNSARGNHFYGNTVSNEWDPASCGYEGARGESARVILYAVTAYYAQGLSLSNNPSDSKTEKTMGTLKTLLKWNRDYPPSDFERLVNERYAKMGHARNAFVDNPEFADYIYDDNGFRTTPYQENVSSMDSSEELNPTFPSTSDYENLDGRELYIASQKDGYSLSSAVRSETTPWYLVGNQVTANAEQMEILLTAEPFLFTSAGGKTYSIKSAKGAYLFGYRCTKGSTNYRSIGFGKDEEEVKSTQSGATFTSISFLWTIEGTGTDIQLHSQADVYLEYYNSSWCGYRAASANPLTLYEA